MKTIFEVGQIVYDSVLFPLCEGVIKEIRPTSFNICVEFRKENTSSTMWYNLKGAICDHSIPTLSTKPYKVDFNGFVQEENLIGKTGYFWDTENPIIVNYGKLKAIDKKRIYPFLSETLAYRYFSLTPPI